MRRDRASISALGIALMRALESARPVEERVCHDPYARQFIPGWFYWMGKFFTMTGFTERRGPGVLAFLAARERHIDEELLTALREGLGQVVILGAGYDSRPYRIPELRAGVKVFEVDHPATQQDKLRRLKKIFGRVPAHVTYASVDFNSESLEDRLLAHGYDPSLRTLFIWQGVTYYLTAEAVDETLAWIAGRCSTGSRVVFDYIDRSVLEGQIRHGEVAGMRRYRWLISEGLIFGIPDGTIAAFLAARGFWLLRDARAVDLHRLYFGGPRRKRKIAPWYGVATTVLAAGE